MVPLPDYSLPWIRSPQQSIPTAAFDAEAGPFFFLLGALLAAKVLRLPTSPTFYRSCKLFPTASTWTHDWSLLTRFSRFAVFEF